MTRTRCYRRSSYLNGRPLKEVSSREMDEMRFWHDRAELDRHDREQQAREPRPDVRVYEEDFLQ